LQLIGVSVIPLLTVYMMGILTSVHRSAGTIGLFAGMICGLARFVDQVPFWRWEALPIWWTNTWWGYLWGIAATAVAMLITTLIRGRATAAELRGLTWATSKSGGDPGQLIAGGALGTQLSEEGAWLAESRKRLLENRSDRETERSWYANPLLWTILVFGAIWTFNLVVFW
jgi:hypothetical protein